MLQVNVNDTQRNAFMILTFILFGNFQTTRLTSTYYYGHTLGVGIYLYTYGIWLVKERVIEDFISKYKSYRELQ